MVDVPTREEFTREIARLDARIAGLPQVPRPPGGARITREGTRFMRGGRPVKFAGVNLEHAVGCGLPGSQPTDAQADAFFAQLGPAMLIRIWAFPGISDQWEANLARIVSAAGRYGQYLLVTLFNGGPHCTSRQIVDYSTPLPAWVAGWVRAVVTRHAGNPTVFGWECGNEFDEFHPNIGAYYGAVTAVVRSCDPDALVGTGGGHASDNADAIATFVRRSGVDFFTLHDYYKPPGSLSPRAAVFDRAAELAGVPWGMGERGFSGPAGGGDTGDQEANARHLATECGLYLGGGSGAAHCGFYCYWDARWVQRETSTAYPGEMSGLYRAICSYRLPVVV